MPGTKRKGKNDAWYLEVTIDGHRYNKTFHGTEKQADKKLAMFYTECMKGKTNHGSTLTIRKLSEMYYSDYVLKKLKPLSCKNARQAMKHINDGLGKKKLSLLKRADIQKWVYAMEDTDLQPVTVRLYYNTLSGMLKYAVRIGLIENSPCHDIELPHAPRKEAKHYTKEEVIALLDALDTLSEDMLHYKVIVYIALFGGLRQGEIIGLNWEDIDFENHTISVVRTRQFVTGRGTIEGSPKTERSVRCITLPETVFKMLSDLLVRQKEMRLKMGNKWVESPQVIRNAYGNPMSADRPTPWLRKFLKAHGLPPITMHGLRHTHTSLLAHLQTNKVDISKRLGHARLSTTLNIYTHLFEDADREIAASLETFTENLRKTHSQN